MKNIYLLFILFPLSLNAQDISYRDFLKLEYTHYFGNSNQDSLLILNKVIIRISNADPFPMVDVYLIEGADTVKIFSGQGYLYNLLENSNQLVFKLVMPPCCCLKHKEVILFEFDRKQEACLIENIFITSDILLPIEDVVYKAKKVSLKKEMDLYKSPYMSNLRYVDECTGDIIEGNRIDRFRALYGLIFYKMLDWQLLMVCVEEVTAQNIIKKKWVVGWYNEKIPKQFSK